MLNNWKMHQHSNLHIVLIHNNASQKLRVFFLWNSRRKKKYIKMGNGNIIVAQCDVNNKQKRNIFSSIFFIS